MSRLSCVGRGIAVPLVPLSDSARFLVSLVGWMACEMGGQSRASEMPWPDGGSPVERETARD